MRAVGLLLLAAILAAGSPAEARTHNGVHSVRMPKLHKARQPKAHIAKPRKPRNAHRSVRIKREDGTVWTGYRDELGTHLTGPDGRRVNCQRSPIGAADIEVACR